MIKLSTLVLLLATTLVYAGNSPSYQDESGKQRNELNYQIHQNQQNSANQKNNVLSNLKRTRLSQWLSDRIASLSGKASGYSAESPKVDLPEPALESIAKGSFNLYKNNRFQIESSSALTDDYMNCMVDPEKIKFRLYTSLSDDITTVKGDSISKIPKRNATYKIYVPGNTEDPQKSGASFAAAYSKAGMEVTLIVVDYSEYKNCSLKGLLPITLPDVGRVTAVLITFLLRNNLTTIENVHLISNKVGIHAVLKAVELVDLTFPRITALDPTLNVLNQVPALRQDCSRTIGFTDIIHTSLDSVLQLADGIPYAVFLPNGGLNFTAGDKNDEQALTYYQKSITKPALYKATQCERFMTYKLGLCNQNPTNWMGEYVDPNKNGKFFLSVNETFPTEDVLRYYLSLESKQNQNDKNKQ